jgi:hypothetical protein
MQQLTGVHIYEKRGEDDWTRLGLVVQLLSILSWKSRYGKIELYTNEAHLEDLRAHGIDKLYDKIDTTTLASVEVDRKRWWAFGKIQIAAQLEPPFVILDTDLWITDFIQFNPYDAYQAYHYEVIFEQHPGNSYIVDPRPLLPEEWRDRWDLQVAPTNTAILFINNKDFAQDWYAASLRIASTTPLVDIQEDLSGSSYMTFIEQRLLPMMAMEKGLPYSTLVSPRYLAHSSLTDGNEWQPKHSDWTDDTKLEFSKIIHIWGLKRALAEPMVKELVKTAILQSTANYPQIKEEYSKVLEYWD